MKDMLSIVCKPIQRAYYLNCLVKERFEYFFLLDRRIPTHSEMENFYSITIDDSDDDGDITEIMSPLVMEKDEELNDNIIETVRLNQLLLKEVEHKAMQTHVLWPRFLPAKEKYDLRKHESALIALMTDTLEWFEDTAKILPSNTSRLFRGLYNIDTSTDAHGISFEINRLRCGKMFGIYVKHQRCGLLIYIPPKDNWTVETKEAIVSTFPVFVPGDELYDAENSDFQVIFFFSFSL